MTLFYAVLYNFRGNEYARFLLTAEDKDTASEILAEETSRDWQVERIVEVAQVNKEIFMEL